MKNQLTHYVTFLRNIRLNKFELFFKHKKYIKKVFFEISVKKNKKVVYEKGKSVFILNACINPFDHQDNSTYNAPTNIHDRYEQVIKGIQSVRETFQSSDIVYIENSNIPINFENQIKNVVDLYFNFSSNEFLQYSRKIANKGVPWTMANLLCLKKLQTVKQYE
jgi:tRNA/tmRNA/rRNA uracil-C5-methylase (TrmA/RlmC/RlmD family)